MSNFTDRAFSVLGQFNARLSAFVEAVKGTTPTPQLPRAALDELLDIAARARTASDAISRSFTLIDVTALDIVDMQVRLQGETVRLASALRELGQAVERQHFVRVAFEDALVALDEAAQLVAAAVFPSAVQGLREVNVKLWDFEKIQWKHYTDILTDVVQRGSIDSTQQVRIQAIADDVARAFSDVNTLLNDLAETRAADAAQLRQRLEQAPVKLTAALKTASEQLAQSSIDTLSAFGPVIKASAKVAEEVAALLRKLTIPVFPSHALLGTCCELVAVPLYESLSGVQAFALLNILARMQATRASGRPLLDGRSVQVTHAFPDRIYLEADRALIDDMEADPGSFEKAPASLHRFKEGSFKQTIFKKGNLQVCFATRPGNRVVIDADIDLYRKVVPHLFGEVLVNHLTGNTTDQFKVRSILDDQSIGPVGGFALLRV
jgi:ElaB/YqjD/DUF883 family membrane-anchored ribosome-binding protein